MSNQTFHKKTQVEILQLEFHSIFIKEVSSKRTNVLLKKEKRVKSESKNESKTTTSLLLVNPTTRQDGHRILIFYFQSICREKKRIFKATEHLFSQKMKQSTLKKALIKISIELLTHPSLSHLSCETNFSVIVAIIY